MCIYNVGPIKKVHVKGEIDFLIFILMQEKHRVTTHFSKPMNSRFFDFRPVGQEHVLPVGEYLGFSDDSPVMSFYTTVNDGKNQQLLIINCFCTAEC